MKVLLADDEKTISITLSDDLQAAGHDVTVVEDGETALRVALNEDFDCVITDIRMPGLDGIELVRRLKETRAQLAIIVITGFGTVEKAVEAMKLGAHDFLQKPFLNEEVVLQLEQIARVKRLEKECERLHGELHKRFRFGNLIGKSARMQEVYELAQAVANSDCSILIEGESGTGKEILAQAIHYNSHRRNKPLIRFSCAVFPESLIEAELFGHEKGAFTDAKQRKTGRFERADQGTIFIDDIDDLAPKTQVKLLRVLQEREFERLGGVRTINVDVRVLAASKLDLFQAVRQNRFREDLYYRLNVVSIELPPLRDRHGDIALLVEHFVNQYGKGKPYQVASEVLEEMEHYPWPGNVRELENAVERAITLTSGTEPLRREHLIPARRDDFPGPQDSAELRPLKEVVTQVEKEHIARVLKANSGHKGKTAKQLGLTRKALWEKMKTYGLSD